MRVYGPRISLRPSRLRLLRYDGQVALPTYTCSICACRDPEYDRRELAHSRTFAMTLNTNKIDDAALALLYLTLHDGYRAWKGFDWEVLDRLHDKGMIHDPVGKVKSVVFTPEGLERAKALFEQMFKQ